MNAHSAPWTLIDIEAGDHLASPGGHVAKAL